MFLTLLLPACATTPPALVEPTVEKVYVKTYVALDPALTVPGVEPVLPSGRITNEDLAADRDAWKALARARGINLSKIAELQPAETHADPPFK